MTKEEYDSFFKATFKEFMDPIAYNHFNVEGTLEFSSILFTPSMAPFEEVVRTIAWFDISSCMPHVVSLEMHS